LPWSLLAITVLSELTCSLSMEEPNGGQYRASWGLRSELPQTTEQNEHWKA
jgi:hypothetical protein